MICKDCLENLSLQGRGSTRPGRCEWCGKLASCSTHALQQQADPRRSIRDRLTRIRERQAELEAYVEEAHQLRLEKLQLLERYETLEKHLTRVPVTVINTRAVINERLGEERRKQRLRLAKELSDRDRQLLIEALEASLGGN